MILSHLLDIDRHPIHLIHQFDKQCAEIKLCFSKFKRGAPGQTEYRSFFYVSSRVIGQEWLTNALNALKPEEEMALHSNIDIGGKKYHIPMIDFMYKGDVNIVKNDLRKLVTTTNCQYWLYDSGSSYHLYFNKPILQEQWYAYLGELLLLRSISADVKVPHVDPRWVGHALRKGYSALRWSKNISVNKGYPTLLLSGQVERGQ